MIDQIRYKWEIVGFHKQTNNYERFIVTSSKKPKELLDKICIYKGDDFLIEQMKLVQRIEP